MGMNVKAPKELSEMCPEELLAEHARLSSEILSGRNSGLLLGERYRNVGERMLQLMKGEK
jgi:hypothetical protein